MRDEHYTPFAGSPPSDPPRREAITVFVMARFRGDRCAPASTAGTRCLLLVARDLSGRFFIGQGDAVERHFSAVIAESPAQLLKLRGQWNHSVAAAVDFHGSRGSGRGCNRVQGAAASLAFTARVAF
jgi:hypothetical protein